MKIQPYLKKTKKTRAFEVEKKQDGLYQLEGLAVEQELVLYCS